MTFSITAKPREAGKNLNEIREQLLVPAVLYGPEVEAISIIVDRNEFLKVYRGAGSNLVELAIEGGKTFSVLIQDIQINVVTRDVQHVDFRQIPMGVEINTEISLNFVGESSAVKMGGTLNKGLENLNVTCLPKDLVGEIEVDMSPLATFEDVIRVSDVKLPNGITVSEDLEAVVLSVTAPLSEEQLKAQDDAETTSIEDIKVEGEKKEEGEVEADVKAGEKKEESEK
ncbi:MAG: 50S ribosomal protein L25 [Candidatus Magasanikbacteria bacterium]|nr:50S ribosomal protein L25 [Candidatus Magasanikbacteria bacterium]